MGQAATYVRCAVLGYAAACVDPHQQLREGITLTRVVDPNQSLSGPKCRTKLAVLWNTAM